MSENILVGYVRKSKAGKGLKVNIDIEALRECKPFDSKDGKTYVSLVVNLGKVEAVIRGDQEVTSISHIVDTKA